MEEPNVSYTLAKWQCSSCSRLVCFQRPKNDDLSPVTKCACEVPNFPIKRNRGRCKDYRRKVYPRG